MKELILEETVVDDDGGVGALAKGVNRGVGYGSFGVL